MVWGLFLGGGTAEHSDFFSAGELPSTLFFGEERGGGRCDVMGADWERTESGIGATLLAVLGINEL